MKIKFSGAESPFPRTLGNDADAVALLKVPRASGTHPENAAPTPLHGGHSRNKCSIPTCCVSGTVPGSELLAMENKRPCRLVKGRGAAPELRTQPVETQRS